MTIPALFHIEKPPLSTNIATALGMTAIAVAMATLGLWVTTVTSALVALEWYVLAIQVYVRRCRRKNVPLIQMPPWFPSRRN